MTATRLAAKPPVAPHTVRGALAAELMRQCLWCIGALVAGLLFIEGMLALAHIGEEQFVEFEPAVGTWHMANKEITWRSEGFSHSLTNSRGYRDREFLIEKPALMKRLVVVGDSMAEGLQVDLSATFASRLQSLLNKGGKRPSFEVINAAMSGHSTVQELYLFKTKVAALQPDICILAYDVGDNEENAPPFGNGSLPPRPYCLIGKDGKLFTDWSHYDAGIESGSACFFRSTAWLRRNSRLWDVLSKLDLQLIADRFYRQGRCLFFPPQAAHTARRVTSTSMDILGTEAPPRPVATAASMRGAAVAGVSTPWRQTLIDSEKRLQLTARLIQLLNAACQKNHCRLLVLGMPAPDNSMLYFRELRWLRQLAHSDGFMFVDANERFPRRAPMQASPLFFNVHMSAAGHALVARQLYQALVENHPAAASIEKL